MKRDWKKWWKAAAIRALKTVAQTLAGTLPVGFVITPVMIQEANWSYLFIILSWIGTGLVSGILSLLTSLAGIPEEQIDEVEDLP
jgi:protein-S-isoprenylcysteine O-methyltransferase Ste14